MNKYIQIIKRGLQIAVVAILAIWAIGYFGSCFYEWQALNPIQWIIDLPIASQRERGAYLGCLGTLTAFSFITAFIEADLSDDTTTSTTIDYSATCHSPTTYHAPTTPRSESSLDAVDIALGVAGGVVIGGIIGDILD